MTAPGDRNERRTAASRWRWFGLLTVWCLVLFTTQRTLFLLFAHQRLAALSWADIGRSYLHGSAMDLSITGYVLLLPALLSILLLFRPSSAGGMRWVQHAIRTWLIAVLVISALVTSADIGLFDAWGSRTDRKALSYLAYPKEALSSTSGGWMLLLVLLAAAQVLVFGPWLLRITRPGPLRQVRPFPRIGGAVLMPALCVLAARGGPQDLPIDKSWAYFSRYPVLNLAALNGIWNLMQIAVEPAEMSANPYAEMRTEEADRLFQERHAPSAAPAPSISRVARPNVLLIMLESWTADIIEPLGGDSGVAPGFTRACQDGLLFTHFYSTGFRTEQGLCALISGFPSQPRTTIIRTYGKFDRLPSLVRELGHAGYSSTYWYAGDAEFANTRAYLEAMGFDKVHDEHSFPIQRRTQWGAFDEELFNFRLHEEHASRRPFFDVLMTATSHEPFDAPVEQVFPGGDEPQRYRNTVHYTDHCLGDFLQKARGQSWYDSTLIVIVADHGHTLPHYLEPFSEARHRIPFLITGGALREDLRGTTNATYGSHVDLAATLLGQLGLPRSSFAWSRDLFDPGVPHDAFWTFNDGFGLADGAQSVSYDEAAHRTIEVRDSSRTADRDRLLRIGKAQLQVEMDRYIGFDQ